MFVSSGVSAQDKGGELVGWLISWSAGDAMGKHDANYYKARGRLMFVLRQTQECKWVSMAEACRAAKLSVEFLKSMLVIEKRAGLSDRRLEWTSTEIRALTKAERVAFNQPAESTPGARAKSAPKPAVSSSDVEVEVEVATVDPYVDVGDSDCEIVAESHKMEPLGPLKPLKRRRRS